MDRELDGEASRQVAQHLEGCPECQRCLHEFGEVDDRVHGLPGIDVTPGFASHVLHAATWGEGEGFSFSLRLKRALAGISESIFSLFEGKVLPSTRILDEFADCPPLSMSFVYFNLLERTNQGY